MKNLDTLFYEELNATFEIHEKGKTRKISAREGIVKRLIHQAMKGDLKAIAYVLAIEPEITKNVEYVKITSSMTVKEAADAYAKSIGRFGA